MEGLHWLGDTAFSCIVYGDRFFGLGKGRSKSESEPEPERLSCEGVWRLGHVFDGTYESG